MFISGARIGVTLGIRRLARICLGQRGFQILESQLTLVVVQLLGAFAMQDLVQLGDQMLQPPVGFLQRVPFPSTARTAARWLSGMADRSMDGAADMKSSYPDPTVVERFYCIQVILKGVDRTWGSSSSLRPVLR